MRGKLGISKGRTWYVVSWDQVPIDVDMRGSQVGLLRAGHHHRGDPVGVGVNLLEKFLMYSFYSFPGLESNRDLFVFHIFTLTLPLSQWQDSNP